MTPIQIRTVVCRVGEEPTIELIDKGLKPMQEIVEGYIECVQLACYPDGRTIDLWCNEEFLLLGLPPNRLVENCQPIMGNFFITASDEGETVGLDNAEAIEWLARAMSWPVGIQL